MARTRDFIQQHSIRDLIVNMGEEHQNEGLHVFSANDKARPLPFTYPFRTDHFSIFLLTEGHLRIKLNLIEYHIKKNHLFVITPDVVIQFLEKSPSCTGMGMGFTTDFLFHTGIYKNHVESFDFFASQAHPVITLQQADTDVLLTMFKWLLKKNSTQDSHPFVKEILNHSFSTLMFELAAVNHKYNKSQSLKLNRKEHLLMRFLKLLPMHFKTQRSVQYYAELLFVTPKYLTETIKEITGKTAGEFIDEMVMTEARLLLANPAYSVAKIADSLYFSDQFFFSKFFKKQEGMTPSAYRKTIYK